MYQSPVEIITRQIRTQFEDNVFKAIQDYGIVVDKEELIKALRYDRGQYENGFSDGMLVRKDEWISVEERLPESRKFVIACDEYGNVGEAYFYKRDRKFEWVDDGERAFVTHWMPLPEPPMKGEGDEENHNGRT
jgi:hypothetical protein